jgi:uncharacterized protein (TIGR03083 family)
MHSEGTTTIDWVNEHRSARARVRSLAQGLAAADAAAPVPPCPEWTVHDVVSHVVGMSVALAAGDFPSGDVQAWIDGLVAARRTHTTDSVLAEWDASGDAVDAFVAGMGAGAGRLVYDVVAHEHDIRLALGRPGERDSSGVAASAVAMSDLLAADLERCGLPAVRITSGGRTWDVGNGEPELSVELDPFELIRVFGSRRSEAQVRALPWRGDLDRYLPALTHLPLPRTDIVE